MSDDDLHWQRVRTLFDRIADADPVQWDALVAEGAADDASLRRDVLQLLRADQADAHDFEDPRALLGGLTEGEERIGAQVSQFRVTRLVGHGGMGTVYEGVRADGLYQQRVAIKFIRPMLAASVMAARFRRERQILAALEHRNIARLLDGGAAPDGAPFFVMEFVDGVAITTFCNDRRMGIDQRLRLFLQACAAVEHAHGKFIVHRDLKPANIFVTADGSVKLLDFGVAKLLGAQDGDDLTTMTQAQPVTPEYASPEQLRDEPVSAASDVYSLGVVLYELLAGRRPFELTSRSPVAALRALEHESPSPSAAVSPGAAVAAGYEGVAAYRRALVGEVDNVVRKAIRADVAERYRSVEQFAADVRALVEGRPVLAQPDSAGYRIRKFVGRNRAGSVAAIVIAAALLITAMVATVQMRRSNAERVWEMAVSAAGNLDELGVERLGRGDIHGSDSVLRAAIALCQTPHPAMLPPLICVRSAYDEGLTLLWKGDAAGAEQTVRPLLSIVQSANGLRAVDPTVLQAATARIDAVLARARDGQGDIPGAVALFQQSDLAFRAARAEDAPDRPEMLGWFAITRERSGDMADADSLVRLQLTLTRGTDQTIVLMHLAEIERKEGRGEDARLRMAGARARRGIERDTTDLYYVVVTEIEALDDLAEGRVDQAVAQLRHTLALAVRQYPTGDPRLADVQDALGQALMAQHRAADAVSVLTTSADIYRGAFGPTHPQTVAAERHLAAAQRVAPPTLVQH